MLALLRFLDRMTGTTGAMVAWLVIPLIFASCYEVVSRYVFDAPTVWAFEVGYMVMGTHFLIGMAYTLRQDAHVRVDFFYGQLSAKKRALIDVFGVRRAGAAGRAMAQRRAVAQGADRVCEP